MPETHKCAEFHCTTETDNEFDGSMYSDMCDDCAERYRKADRRDKFETVRRLYSDVRSNPGFGDTGRYVDIVEHTCDSCGYDRAYRTTYLNPETREVPAIGCTNPVCPNHEIPAGLRSRI